MKGLEKQLPSKANLRHFFQLNCSNVGLKQCEGPWGFHNCQGDWVRGGRGDWVGGGLGWVGIRDRFPGAVCYRAFGGGSDFCLAWHTM